MTIKHDNTSGIQMALLGLLLLAWPCSAAEGSLRSRNLIIGGSSARPNRFPYYVALKDYNREIQCGGTLIAPDIVLTAAHCRNSNLAYADVGKYHKIDPEGMGEEIPILNPFEMISEGWSSVRNLETANATLLDSAGFMHPKHDLMARTYDVMLIKLARPALGRPIVMLNQDKKTPQKQPGGKNEITIIGMGNTENTGWYPKPATLRQVHVDYLPYDECVDVQNFNLDYKFELLPHMICTQGAGVYGDRGQCYGDSGGPYILMGEDPNGYQDLQVAVVSWAVNCASSLFPMVGSRTSHSMDFIKEITCSLSSAPPDYLCFQENNSIDETMLSRYIPDGVKVSVRIYSDPYGHELRWKITDFTDPNIVYAEALNGDITGDHSFQDVMVPAGGNLKFTIDDAADDGIFGNPDSILYEVVLVGTGGELIMVEGNGQFGTSREETFKVPQLTDDYIALVRASKIESKQVATVVGPTADFKIHIDFSDYHEDTSWMVTSLDETQTMAFEDVGHYRYGDEVTETVKLQAGTYKFIIRDRHGTDDFRAFDSYTGYVLDGTNKTVLFESQFKEQPWTLGKDEYVHEFTIPESAVSVPATSTNPAVIFDETLDLQKGTLEAHKNKGNNESECLTLRKLQHMCTKNEQCCSGNCSKFKCAPPMQEDTFSGRIEYAERGSVNENTGGVGRGRFPNGL